MHVPDTEITTLLTSASGQADRRRAVRPLPTPNTA